MMEKINEFEAMFTKQDTEIQMNKRTIRNLEEEFALFKSRFEDLFAQLGAKFDGFGDVDWS